MKRSLSKMNTNELRDLAVSLGADRKKLYGTSKQALILIIGDLERGANAPPPRTPSIPSCFASGIGKMPPGSGTSTPTWSMMGTESSRKSSGQKCPSTLRRRKL